MNDRRNSRVYRFTGMLLCICIMWTFTSVNCIAAVNHNEGENRAKTVRVGWLEGSFNTTGENGERSGYSYEYEQTVAAYAGWKYQYVKVDWSNVWEKLQSGEIDLMGGISYTDERAEKMLFSDITMGDEKYYLYVDVEKNDISASNLRSLEGKSIGVLKNGTPEEMFSEWEKAHDIHTKHVNIVSRKDTLEKISDKTIDGFISTEALPESNLNIQAVTNVGSSGIYFAINKNRGDLKEDIDNAMRIIDQDRPFYADELYKKYFAQSSVAVLSHEEKEWLKAHGPIRAGYVLGDPEISEIDSETGKMVGLLNDYVTYASDCLGNAKLEFELHGFNSREEQVVALQNNKIDMIFHVSQNPYAAEQRGFALSDTAWTFNLAAITSRDYFDESDANSIAVDRDNFALKNYISYNYPNWKVIEYESLEESHNAAMNGEADCFVTGSSQVMNFIDNHRVHCVFLSQPGNASFAVNQGDVMLLSILNKTLKTMSVSVLNGALSTYEGNQQKITIENFIEDNLLEVTVASITLFLLILILVLGFLHKEKAASRRAMELNRKLEESQTELQKAFVQAENANAAKSNFLFNMSHDIRTPMNALLGYTKLMKNELEDPKLIDYQEKIEQSGNLLLSIINNVLDMARIESGKIELDENYSNIETVLEEISGVFEAEAAKKGVLLMHSMDVRNTHIMCDETKVKEIFINLVSNAVKYTPEGGMVNMKVRELDGAPKGYVRVCTEVIDNGIGMSKEFLPTLFDSFTREYNTTIGKVAGTGLGMPIVKKLVDMMGGTIKVESEPGKGSTFTVIMQHRIANEIYYSHKTEKRNEAARSELIRGKRILMAEDNELNAEIAIAILSEMGCEIDHVWDGIECVSKMKQMPPGCYDLILMDIQMPGMDGYKATEAIRQFEDSEKSGIPIIAMTANAFEEDRKVAFERGMNGHIAKPLDVSQIEAVMLSVMTHGGQKEEVK